MSFSVIPTARLSAEGVGIAGLASDSEAFSVESVSFGLSLLPLITGNIEIYGVTITRPQILVETYENGSTNWSSADAAGETPASIEDMIAEQAPPSENATGDAIAALDRLSIGRVRIEEGTLLWRDIAAGREERIEQLDLDIRVPRLDGAGTVEGSFTRMGTTQSFELEIGARPDPASFSSIPATLTLSSDGGTVIVQGTALAGETLFNGTVEAEGKSFAGLARGFGIDLVDMPVFSTFDIAARINASANEIRIDNFAVDFGGLMARGGAVVGLDRARPGIGIKIEADRIDTALFVAEADADADGDSGYGDAPAAAGSDNLDFSPLRQVDANIEFDAKEVLIGAVPITDFGVTIQIVNGGLNTTIRSANVNGAPGSGAFVVDTSGSIPTINGNIDVNGLDAAGLVALVGADLPAAEGTLGLDVEFATSGATQTALIDNLDASGHLSLANGRVTDLDIADLVGGDASANEIGDVEFLAEFSSLNAPIDAKGGFSWRDERFTVAARADARALAAGKTTSVSIDGASNRVNFGFSGEAGLTGLGNGTVSVSTPSLRNLLAWIGQPLAPGGGLGPFSIKGNVSLSEASFSFEKADFTLDGSSGVGTGSVIFGGTPKISAGLAMQRLDVTPYLLASGAASGGGGGANTAGSGGGSGGGWNSDTIGFDGLRAIDANLNFKADAIIVDQITIGPSNLTATISGGKLSTELTEMSLYSGLGVGTLTIDGSASPPSIETLFRLDGIDALPFLQDAAGFSRIEGTASFSFALQSVGDSEAALMAALDGKGAMDFRDGAIRGINIPKMVRNLSVDTLLGWQQADNEKTDFSEFSGTYTIENGILTNSDLLLVGPLLRVTGAGTADIPQKTLAYRVDPKIVASLEGQGGSQELEGFSVPIRVEGSWSQPRIYPDIEGILQDPQKALDQLRNLGGSLFGGTTNGESQSDGSGGNSVEDILKNEVTKGLDKLFGNSGGQTQNPPPATDTPTAETSPAPAPEGQPAVQPPLDLTTPLNQLLGGSPSDTPASQEPQAGAPQDGASQTEPTAPPPADPATDLLKSLFGQ